MAVKNYTPIDDLIKKYRQKTVTGSMTKEAEPFNYKEPLEIKETVEYEPEDEVGQYVGSRQETIKLPPGLKELGVEPVVSTKFPTYQNIRLPLPDERIVVGLHAPITSSFRWLATLALYMLQQAHQGLRVVHGKVVRVLKK